MSNVLYKVVGKNLHIEVDLSQEQGISSSGKSMLIATDTVKVSSDVKFTLSVYKPLKK
jgi:hypothetical protein